MASPDTSDLLRSVQAAGPSLIGGGLRIAATHDERAATLIVVYYFANQEHSST